MKVLYLAVTINGGGDTSGHVTEATVHVKC